MEIRRRPANTFIDRLYCDCGEELYSAEMQMTHPPKYLHRCKKCSFSWADLERYPCLRHEEYGDDKHIVKSEVISKDKYKLWSK
jgi:hypothetical protein